MADRRAEIGRVRIPDNESLTIVLPAYNEAARIEPALDELFGYLGRRADLPRPAARLFAGNRPDPLGGLGRPFVGRAGQVLRAALQDAMIEEAGVFIVNSIACRPVPVHPRRSAVAACHDRLLGELLLAPAR